MKFIRHPQHNADMGAPKGWDAAKHGPCEALSICDMRNTHTPRMESAWVPEGFEGALLAMGLADIRLGIVSNVHPPVYMFAHTRMLPHTTNKQEALGKLLSDLGKFAVDNGLSVTMLPSPEGHNICVVDHKK